MKLLKYIPVFLTIALVIGILIETYFVISISALTSVFAIFFLLFLAIHYITNKQLKNPWYYLVMVFFIFVIIGMFSVNIQNTLNYKQHHNNYLEKENSILLKITKTLKSTKYYDRYQAKVIQVNNKKTIGKVLVNKKKDSLNKLKIGNVYYTENLFKKINKPKNPYQFNYRKYLKRKQIIHQITLTDKNYIVSKSNAFSISIIASNIRSRIQKNLKQKNFTKDAFGIINALLLGQRQDVSKELIQDYQNAGAMHILAVSGLHIGIIYGILLVLFLPIKRLNFNSIKGKTIQILLVILFLWSYAILASLSASVVRATTMFTAIALGLLSKRKTNTLHNLFISMFVLLLFHPNFLFDVGFQLSYLAVFSIVYWQPKFNACYQPKNKIFRFFWQICTVSFAAQIGILPLSLFYFHQFPLLFFVSSLVIIPVLGIVLGFGFLVLFLAYFNILPNFIVSVYGEIIEKMNVFIQFIAKQEQFLIKNIFFSVFLVFGFYFLIIAIYRFFEKQNFKKLQTILIVILGIQLIYFYEKYQRETTKEMIIFNQSKHSIIGFRNGNSLNIYHNLDNFSKHSIIDTYQKGTGVSTIKIYDSIPNIFKNNMLVIDSVGVFNVKNLDSKIVLLRNSPKINIDRLFQFYKPKILIADASNFKSYAIYWGKKCAEKNVHFYNTHKNGAYRKKLIYSY